MALTKTTKDHDEIQRWAESRSAVPAQVASTAGDRNTGILRFEFPGAPNAEDSALEEISWDEFFEKFDQSGLELLYQEETAEGQKSNFNKLVYPESDSASTKGRKATSRKSAAKASGRKGASKKKAAKKTAGRKTAAKKSAPRASNAAKKRAGKSAKKSAGNRTATAKKASGGRTAAAKRSASAKKGGAGKKSASSKKSSRR
jgi:hypothetical protein